MNEGEQMLRNFYAVTGSFFGTFVGQQVGDVQAICAASKRLFTFKMIDDEE